MLEKGKKKAGRGNKAGMAFFGFGNGSGRLIFGLRVVFDVGFCKVQAWAKNNLRDGIG